MFEPIALQIGGLGPPELLVVLLLAVLLFGADRIPKLARSTGEALGEFEKGRQQIEEELRQASEGMPTGDDADLGFENGRERDRN